MNDLTSTQDQRRDSTDEAFDALVAERLSAHFRAELDPQVGRAHCKLDAMLEERTRRLRIVFRWSAAAVLLVGLGIALAVVRSTVQRPAAPEAIAHTTPAAATESIFTCWAETYDAGTVLVDAGTPVRVLRRVEYEKTEWKDASGQWRSAITSPRQDVILVDLQQQ